jgi:hypothetical protein
MATRKVKGHVFRSGRRSGLEMGKVSAAGGSCSGRVHGTICGTGAADGPQMEFCNGAKALRTLGQETLSPPASLF